MKKAWEAFNNLVNRKTKKSGQVNTIKGINNSNKINCNPQRIADINTK